MPLNAADRSYLEGKSFLELNDMVREKTEPSPGMKTPEGRRELLVVMNAKREAMTKAELLAFFNAQEKRQGIR